MTDPRVGANPYVGPRPFKEGERLFGRDQELTELTHLLGAERIVLLHSPSGAGKSSLIQAGLVPKLRGRFDVWNTTRVGHPLPADVPRDTNLHVLSAVLGLEQGVEEGGRRTASQLAGLRLAEYWKGRPRVAGAPERVLLVFDQFEEVLTTDPLAVDAKRAFFDQLGELLQHPLVWALFALREEYIAPLDPYAERVPTHLRNRHRIDLLGLDAAQAAIVQPVPVGGRAWTKLAATKLAHDLATVKVQQPGGGTVEQPGRYVEPMQMQVVCYQLWEKLPPDVLSIEPEHVTEFGNVTDALAKFYAAEVEKIAGGERVERAMRAWVGERLIIADGIRAPLLQTPSTSGGLENRLIDQMADRQLVRAERRGGATWYELAHDRLVDPIRKDNARWELAKLQPVQVQAALWERQGKPSALLLSEEALAAAEKWVAMQPEPPGEPDSSFLEASRVKVKAAARLRLFLGLAGSFGLLAMLGLALSYWQYTEAVRQTAEAVRQTGLANEAAVRARDHARMVAVRDANGDPTTQAALLRDVERPAEARRWLQLGAALRQTPLAHAVLERRSDNSEDSLAITPDESRVVTTTGTAASVWRLDGIGDPVVLTGFTGKIQQTSFSPDGSRVVSGSEGNTARVWQVDGGGAPVVLSGHTGAVSTASFSPDGLHVVTGASDWTARVWRSDGIGEPVVLSRHTSPVVSATFLQGGSRVVTIATDSVALLWRADGVGDPVDLRRNDAAVQAFMLSPEGTYVLTTMKDESVHVRRTDGTGKTLIVQALDDQGLPVTERWWTNDPKGDYIYGDDITKVESFDFSADERHFLAVWGHWVWVVKADAPGEPVILKGPAGVASAAFSADGDRVVAVYTDWTVRVWRSDGTGEPIVLDGHTAIIESAELSPDGRQVVTTSADRTVRLWSADGITEPIVLPSGGVASSSAWFSRNGRWIGTVSNQGMVRIWRAKFTRYPVVMRGFKQRANHGASFSPDGSRILTYIARTGGGFLNPEVLKTAHVWPSNGTGEPIPLIGHEARVSSAEFSPDGTRVLTTSEDQTARLWRADGAGEPVVFKHPDEVLAGSFSPDGDRILTTSKSGTARVWRTDAPDLPLVLAPAQGLEVASAAFSPDGSHVLASIRDPKANPMLNDDAWTTQIWRIDGMEAPSMSTKFKERIHTPSTACSPDGNRLVTYSDGSVRVRRIDGTGEPVLVKGHPMPSIVLFSPDGEHVLTTTDVVSDRSVRVVRADGTGEPVVLAGSDYHVWSAEFSPDGSHVVTTAKDRTVRVWRTDGQEEPIILSGHESDDITASFSRDGTRVVTAATDNTWRVWDIPTRAQTLDRLWHATTYCLSEARRIELLSETKAEAADHFAACKARVALYSILGAYR